MSSHQNISEMATNLFHTKSHQHPLELKSYIKPYICDGCKVQGFGSRYRCEQCDFDLHEHCLEVTPSTTHKFFPNSTFDFFTIPPKASHKHCKRQCGACRKSVNGFVYHCKEHDLDLHPGCRNLKRRYKMKGGELVFNLHKNVKQKCLWCNEKSIKEGDRSNGWSYISKCKKYHVHVACVTEILLEEWNNNSHTINKIVNYNVKEDDLKALALYKVNLKEVQTTRNWNGKSWNMCWRILKVLIQTTVGSIVIRDPKVVLATLLLELLS